MVQDRITYFTASLVASLTESSQSSTWCLNTLQPLPHQDFSGQQLWSTLDDSTDSSLERHNPAQSSCEFPIENNHRRCELCTLRTSTEGMQHARHNNMTNAPPRHHNTNCLTHTLHTHYKQQQLVTTQSDRKINHLDGKSTQPKPDNVRQLELCS